MVMKRLKQYYKLQQIKNSIKVEESINTAIIGHTAADNKEIIDKFIDNEADYFEIKLPITEILKNHA